MIISVLFIKDLECFYKYEKLLEFCTNERKEKITRFRFSKDKIRSLFSELLLLKILKENFDIELNNIEYVLNEYGKPFLKNQSDIFFNISHSSNYVAVAVDKKVIGIDIEKKKDIDLKIAKRFFSEREFDDISKCNNQKEYFFDLWTLKESYIKAIGKGLAIPLSEFVISKHGMDFVLKKPYKNYKYFFKQYEVAEKIKLSVCSEKKEFVDKIVKTKEIDILNYYNY